MLTLEYPDKIGWIVKTSTPSIYLCNRADGLVVFLVKEHAEAKALQYSGEVKEWNLGELEKKLIWLGVGLVVQTEDGRRYITTGFCRRAFGRRIVQQSGGRAKRSASPVVG